MKRIPPGKKDLHGLTPRQRSFADLYLAGRSAGSAYERAGFLSRGRIAHAEAWKLLRHPAVSRYIRETADQRNAAVAMRRMELVAHLVAVIRTGPGELGPDSNLLEHYQCIELSGGRRRTTIRIMDKIQAAKLICQMLGWNHPEKSPHSMEITINHPHAA